MTLKVMQKTRDRLNATPRGAALLKLVDEYETPIKLAEKLGFDEQQVRQWIYNARMSKLGALRMEEFTGRSRLEFRPDLDITDWDTKQQGPVLGKPAVARTPDAKLLVKLAQQYGSVKELCAAACVTVGDYHTWKTRGRIPAIKLPTFLGLQK